MSVSVTVCVVSEFSVCVCVCVVSEFSVCVCVFVSEFFFSRLNTVFVCVSTCGFECMIS
jgi:hypothetical protein